MKKKIFILSILILSAFLLVAAKKKSKKVQYKKFNRDQISALTKGKYKEVEAYFRKFLKNNPKDLESHYGITLALAGQGKAKEAVEQIKLGLKDGIDFGRFIAGPRNLLKNVYASEAYQELKAKYKKPMIHGPMIGFTSDVESSVWLRTDIKRAVTVEVSEKEDFSKISSSGSNASNPEQDFTAVVKIQKLKANTKYFYRIKIDGEEQKAVHKQTFSTFPAKQSDQKFTIAFGGGAGYTPQYEKMWSVIESHKPKAMLLLGDNVYIDTPEIAETQKYCYYRRQSVPVYRSFTAQTPVFAIYDDHDFGDNDCYGGLDKDFPKWKRPVLEIFKQNWASPYYGGGEENPGCWFKFSIGNVDFFMLDCRYYREKQTLKKSGKTMLGAYQKAWLKKEMLASKAKFKVICSSVPVARGTKNGTAGMDTWDGYDEEREEIFDFLADNKVGGIFFASADRHRSDAWKIERKKGYPIYEFMSSRLTNIHTHPVIKGSLFGYNKTCSFGKLTFDMSKDDPEMTYEIYCIDNEKRGSITLKLSQLKN
jgi:alkaline phosphatase D